MVKLGYHPATWGGRLEGLWKGIECMASCGWDGFEYSYRDITEWYDRPGEFRRKLGEHGLSLAALYISSGYRDAAEVAEHPKDQLKAGTSAKTLIPSAVFASGSLDAAGDGYPSGRSGGPLMIVSARMVRPFGVIVRTRKYRLVGPCAATCDSGAAGTKSSAAMTSRMICLIGVPLSRC